MSVERHKITSLTVAGEAFRIDRLELLVRRDAYRYSWDAVGSVAGISRRPLSQESVEVVMTGPDGTFTGQAFIDIGVSVQGSDARTALNIRGTGALEGA